MDEVDRSDALRPETMKAMSLKEPWATMIYAGNKTIETRTWPTRHRGPLLIVGSLKPNAGAFCGKACCVVDLSDCRPMQEQDEDAACCQIYPGAWAWVLKNMRHIKPFSVKGQLGIYDVPMEKIIYE